MNKKALLAIILISIGLTTFGLIIDTDPQSEHVWSTVVDYFAMLALTFTILTTLYLTSTIIIKPLLKKIIK